MSRWLRWQRGEQGWVPWAVLQADTYMHEELKDEWDRKRRETGPPQVGIAGAQLPAYHGYKTDENSGSSQPGTSWRLVPNGASCGRACPPLSDTWPSLNAVAWSTGSSSRGGLPAPASRPQWDLPAVPELMFECLTKLVPLPDMDIQSNVCTEHPVFFEHGRKLKVGDPGQGKHSL